MKWLFLIAMAVAISLPPYAQAQGNRGFRPGMQGQGEQPRKGPPPEQRGERDKRVEHDKRHPGRLTEEQRRGLHKDLDRANREIYKR